MALSSLNPIAIGNALLKSLFTAKGQILVGTGSGTVSTLDPATNDFVLTLDSSTATGLKWATTSPGVSSFTALSDTPDSYTGQELKFVRVNSGGTALEFIDIIDGGDSI
jgi:hypothetical protein